jgi:hypothetical protein
MDKENVQPTWNITHKATRVNKTITMCNISKWTNESLVEVMDVMERVKGYYFHFIQIVCKNKYKVEVIGRKCFYNSLEYK